MDKNKFLEKIKNKKPTPKWIFVSKNILFWSIFLLFIIIGLLSTSLIIYLIFNTGFDLNNIIYSIPYLWIFFTTILFLLSYFNFKKIGNNYKYLTIKNIFITLIMSIVFGILFYNIGFSEFLDKKLKNNVVVYNNYINQHMISVWNNPKNGFLLGTVLEIKSSDDFILLDINNKKWEIILTNETIKRGRVSIKTNEQIKIIGEMIDDNKFKSSNIRPMFGKKSIIETKTQQ